MDVSLIGYSFPITRPEKQSWQTVTREPIPAPANIAPFRKLLLILMVKYFIF